MSSIFETEYKKLNKSQKQAVDTIEGPVMVVAGPGTGKTQVLALRIANILKKTDTGAQGILCLTFTNSGVREMRDRLFKIIGPDSSKVHISTFHSFALELVEKNYALLGFDEIPELLDTAGSISVFDDLLENNDWKYLRPRGNSTQYFYDVRSLISLLKRENIAPDEFLNIINLEIESLNIDPSSISTRGETKGQIKKEVLTRIERLQRTSEVVDFYKLYESYKKDNNYLDYDDVLRQMVLLVVMSEDIRNDIREMYLYVLIDEHQDSSGVQNEFLQKVWQDTDMPNIFVVGDDRQLIYGFGGAKAEYFENFKTLFGYAELVSLTDNYRSTQSVLNVADSLLQSSMVKDKLESQGSVGGPVVCVEAPYMRDEILLAAIDIEKKIQSGMNPNNIAVLVPKNSHVRNAITILRDMGLHVAVGAQSDLFMSTDALMLIAILRIAYNPYSSVHIAEYVLSAYSGIPAIAAHSFLRTSKNLSIESFTSNNSIQKGFLQEVDPVYMAGIFLSDCINYSAVHNVYETIQYVGERLLLSNAIDHVSLTHRAEVVRTMLQLCLAFDLRKKQENNLKNYLTYIGRLNQYGEHIPIAVFGQNDGIKVMTMHSSKGLEFEYVWVAHMDEKSLFSTKTGGFTFPEKIEILVEEKNDIVVKRQVYVAITRAKKYCTISYACNNYTGAHLARAHIFDEIPDSFFKRVDVEQSEKTLLDYGIEKTLVNNSQESSLGKEQLALIVKNEYTKTRVAVTLLNNFFECPWKWYFRNLLKLPEPKSSSLNFGSVVHNCIEEILNYNSKVSDDFIKQSIEKSINRNNIIDKNEIRRITKESINLLNSWIKIRLPEISKNHDAEKDVSYKDNEFPHLNLYGKIDLTEKLDDDNVRVTDFKTGSSKSKNIIEKDSEEGRMSQYLRQLTMYSYLIQGNNKHTIVVESVLEFLEEDAKNKDAIYKTTINAEHIDLLRRDIKEYDLLLKSGDWIRRPCYVKTYGTSSTEDAGCEHCRLADRIYGK